jgi:hypothetical protein
MPNRTLVLVFKTVALIAALAVFATADVRESAAQQKKKNFWDGFKCECICSAGGQTDVRNYDAVASCSAYNRKACQIDDGNVIRTGSLTGCQTWIPADVPRSGPTAGNEQRPKPKRPKHAPAVKPSGRGTN